MQITNIEKNFLDFLLTEDVFIPLEIYQWKDKNLSGFGKHSKLGVTFFYLSGSCKLTGSFSPLLVKNGSVVWVMAFTGQSPPPRAEQRTRWMSPGAGGGELPPPTLHRRAAGPGEGPADGRRDRRPPGEGAFTLTWEWSIRVMFFNCAESKCTRALGSLSSFRVFCICYGSMQICLHSTLLCDFFLCLY